MQIPDTRDSITPHDLIIPKPQSPQHKLKTSLAIAAATIALQLTLGTIATPAADERIPHNAWFLIVAIATLLVDKTTFVPRYDIQIHHVIRNLAYAATLAVVGKYHLTNEWVLNPQNVLPQLLTEPLQHPLLLIAAYVYVLTISRIVKQQTSYDAFAVPTALTALYFTTATVNPLIPIVINAGALIASAQYGTPTVETIRQPPGIRIEHDHLPQPWNKPKS